MTHAERKARRQSIARDAKAGLTIADLVRLYKFSAGTVAAACHEHGVKPIWEGTKPLHATTYDILADLFRPGASLRKIARERGVSAHRVHRIYVAARDAGVPVPERPRAGTEEQSP